MRVSQESEYLRRRGITPTIEAVEAYRLGVAGGEAVAHGVLEARDREIRDLRNRLAEIARMAGRS